MRTALLVMLAIALAAVWLQLGSARPGAAPNAHDARYAPDGTWRGAKTPRDDAPPNIIVIVVDTLRADCAEPGAQMPGLLRLAERGVRFTNATTPAVWTYPAVTSLLTGLLPDRHGVRHTAALPRLPRSFTTYPEALTRGHGYTTAAFLDLELRPSRDSMLQGFEHVRFGIPLSATRQAVAEWNAQRDRAQPFFALIHTFQAHEPYGEANHPYPRPRPEPGPAPDLDSLTGAEIEAMNDLDWRMRQLMLRRHGVRFMRRLGEYRARGFAANPDWKLAARLEAAYRDGVAWVDRELERTVETLEHAGMLENTILIVTADHGESFGEHGVLAHGRTLYDELVKVPLIVVGPAPFTGGRLDDTTVCLTDVMPTVFELAGLPAIPETDGASILADVQGGGAGTAKLGLERRDHHTDGPDHDVMLVSARTARFKYLVRYDVLAGTVRESLFDLVRDPGETDDLLLANGRMGRHPVSPALAAGIEQARDRVWESADAATAYAQMGYAGAAPRIDLARPEPPVRR